MLTIGVWHTLAVKYTCPNTTHAEPTITNVQFTSLIMIKYLKC